MGYALFAAQKINYSNLVFNYQMQLDVISQKMLALTEYAANIADGRYSIEDYCNSTYSDPSNFVAFNSNQSEYVNAADEKYNFGTIAASNIPDFDESNEEHQAQYSSIYASLQDKYAKEYADQITKQLEVEEHKLELQKNKIETKLTAAQKQLEQIEQAEGQAIEKATPKYAGLG